MSIKNLVDQSRPKAKITLKCEFVAADNAHAKAVDDLAKKCADELELAMIGQVSLPMGEPAPAQTVAGTADGLVVTESDKKGLPNPDDPPGGDDAEAAAGEPAAAQEPEVPFSDPTVEEPEQEPVGASKQRRFFGQRRDRPVAAPPA